jgi:hypothetical protein
MWFLTIFNLLWAIWTTGPQCDQDCQQGRKDCKCKGRVIG